MPLQFMPLQVDKQGKILPENACPIQKRIGWMKMRLLIGGWTTTFTTRGSTAIKAVCLLVVFCYIITTTSTVYIRDFPYTPH